MPLYMIRYSEIGLKSKYVKNAFVKALRKNLLRYMEVLGLSGEISYDGGHLYLASSDEVDRILSRTFGIKSFSRTMKVSTRVSEIESAALDIASHFSGSFAIRCRRIGHHPFTSQEMAARIGGLVKSHLGLDVDLTSPDHKLFIEVRQGRTYLYTDKVPGLGGFPLGTQGLVVCPLKDENSLASGWLMMRRGCRLVVNESEHTVILRGWDPDLQVVQLLDIDTAVSMIRRGEVQGLVVGITPDRCDDLSEFPPDVPVFTPLLTYDPHEIMHIVNDPPVQAWYSRVDRHEG